ncbi:kinase-like protein, partial [Mytilinidion resinicola]
FLRAQSLVLTPRSELSSCETGQHVYAAAQNQLPFRKLETLGTGNSRQVELVESHTTKRHPVADCDLSHYLKHPISSRGYQGTLKTFFGCLATALGYLHGFDIRHKDIKPSNILIYNGDVLLTDFRISRDCDNTRGTTEGPTPMTPKYAAPEAADYAPRNSSSDIWSLGCVFLEMITVVKG